jgi:hypothetical protein
MSLNQYWPSQENIKTCIYSEAEELTDALLLAVHHPTQLVTTSYAGAEFVEKNEHHLLEHLLKTNRPIPVVGESGSGKSHLVRWLHASLKKHPKVIEERWHIIRVPKNATIREVLTRLLTGLEGTNFEVARSKIKEIGTDLSKDLIEDLFFSYVCKALRDLAGVAKSDAIEANNNKLDEKAKYSRDIFSTATSLSVCLADPLFKQIFSGKGKPVSNVVERLFNVKSYAEVEGENYEIQEHDINVDDIDFDDLGVNARQEIEKLRLAFDVKKIKQSTELLNQAVNASTKLIFNHLFQFNGGSFQDLFVDIRRALKEENRTLVILVEDLAAISAIDDVLIDSLLQEDTYDGVQNLCPLKSVIATTTNQETYKSRRETILTRTGFEWRIPTEQDLIKMNSEVKPDVEQLIDFCSRYINAARHGMPEINSIISKAEEPGFIFPVWQLDPLDEEDIQTIDDFGCSSLGIPLFPFNKIAIRKLAGLTIYCSGRKKFNPRVVIKDILLPILRDCHKDYEYKNYPSEAFNQLYGSAGIDDVKATLLRTEHDIVTRGRLNGFLAVYGIGNTAKDIYKSLSVRQVRAFNLPEKGFSEQIEIFIPSEVSDVKVRYCTDCGKETLSCICDSNYSTVTNQDDDIKHVNDETADIERDVNAWFSGEKQLSQNRANVLRKQLFEMISEFPSLSYYGVEQTK